MTTAVKDENRSPKGDHNRRIVLGLDIDRFAALVGVTPEVLHAYETTGPDQDFDLDVAHWVGVALDRLEATESERRK